ncbi:MAG: FliM/FliN family flagellar motor switch protein [Pirellulales bacterium]|nr:FliM/FliN family flagellar motor switch protein [Pirellulales bacterium]
MSAESPAPNATPGDSLESAAEPALDSGATVPSAEARDAALAELSPSATASGAALASTMPTRPLASTAGANRRNLRDLPAYTRSLLRIPLAVSVSLASKKQNLHQILQFGPGSIIQFDKSCEEFLSLEVGGQVVARGEAVKVGEKFGLRIAQITLPQERFRAMKGKTGAG